jgi:hypothetical protein
VSLDFDDTKVHFGKRLLNERIISSEIEQQHACKEREGETTGTMNAIIRDCKVDGSRSIDHMCRRHKIAHDT